MKTITLSHKLNLREDIHKSKMDVLTSLQTQLFDAVNGFSTIAYHSMFTNNRTDIWEDKEYLFTDDKEIKKDIIKSYIDYLDKNFVTFSHKRYYLYITNEIKSIYSNYNYRFLSYSRFILRNINKKVSDLYDNNSIVLYKSRKNIKKDLNREDYPLNEAVIKNITEKLEKFSISDENINIILKDFEEKYSLLDKIEVDKEFILMYNPDFIFRKYFFREDNTDDKFLVPEKLTDEEVVNLMKKFDLVKYVHKKIKPTYIKTLDVSLFADGIVRRKYGKNGLKDIIDVRDSQKSLFCLDKSIGNQYFIKIVNPFNTTSEIKIPVEYNSYIFKSFKGKKYGLTPDKTTLSIVFMRGENPFVKVFNTYNIETKVSDSNMINILSYDLGSSNIFAGSVIEFPKNMLENVKNEFKDMELGKLSHTERAQLLKNYFGSEKGKEIVKIMKYSLKIKKQFLEHSKKAVEKMNKYKSKIDALKSLKDLAKNNKDFDEVKLKNKEIKEEYRRFDNLKRTIIGNILNKVLFNVGFLDHIFLEDLSFAGGKVKKMNKISSNILHGKFLTKLNYKNKLINGDLGHISKVLSEFTSILCNDCGCIDEKNRKTQDLFKCIFCGNSAQADLNASINIAIFGLIGFIVKEFA